MVAALPDCTKITGDSAAVLIWQDRKFDWSADGYQSRQDSLAGTVTVLAPKPIIDILAAGFVPTVHRPPPRELF